MAVWMWAEGVQWILLRNPIYIYGEDYQEWILLRNPIYIYGEDYQALHRVKNKKRDQRISASNMKPTAPENSGKVALTSPIARDLAASSRLARVTSA